MQRCGARDERGFSDKKGKKRGCEQNGQVTTVTLATLQKSGDGATELSTPPAVPCGAHARTPTGSLLLSFNTNVQEFSQNFPDSSWVLGATHTGCYTGVGHGDNDNFNLQSSIFNLQSGTCKLTSGNIHHLHSYPPVRSACIKSGEE